MSADLQPAASRPQTNKLQDSKPLVTHAGEISGMQFLDELECRHNRVLDELDTLNTRIQEVLKLYAERRQTTVA